MKHLFLVCFLSIILIKSHAQRQNSLKIHGGAEFTSGFFADGYEAGWGIYVTDYIEVNKGGNIVLSTGGAFWNSKGEPVSKAGIWLTRFGYRQFVISGLYLQSDAGLGIGLKNFTGSTRFVFGVGPGYLIKNKTGGGFDINVRYNRGFNRTWFGLGVGYQFNL